MRITATAGHGASPIVIRPYHLRGSMGVRYFMIRTWPAAGAGIPHYYVKVRSLEKNASIRSASSKDIDSIHEIITSYSKDGILLSRTLDDITRNLENFLVAEISGTAVGVITFFDYGDHLKEVRSLAVNKGYLRRGIGSLLLKALIKRLNAANTPRIFVLTYTPAFFEKNGFSMINMDTLPEKIWKDCVYCDKQDNCTETAMECILA
jgi:amino-acid N-acetyltransferase